MIGVLLFLSSAVASVVQGAPKVTDGDTIRIEDTRIRFEGIDAPELSQSCNRADGARWMCGAEAKAALIKKIGNQSVRCDISGTDRYHRSLGTCWVGNLNLNQWLVQSGWAVAYRHYSVRYVPDEEKARGQHRNIWSGEFQIPADYRAAHRH